MEFELAFKCRVLNAKLPMADLLNTFIEGGHYSHWGNCYCPFHDNTNTCSAKIYESPEGDCLYCFAERRRYRPADVFLKGLASVSLDEMFFSGLGFFISC